MEHPPIFIVGPSRSGTALTRSILNRHPGVSIVGETHYFDDLRVTLGAGAARALEPADRQRCEDYFLRLSHRPFGHQGRPEAGWLDRASLRARAKKLGPGGDAYFEAYCRSFADRSDASRWGEKTPRHVFRIDDILGVYPLAKIVCMIRDPRSVVLSYRDWKVGFGFFDTDENPDPEHGRAIAEDEERAQRSYHPVLLSLLWRSQAMAIQLARARHADRVRILRYEDLVADPGSVVPVLADWLDLDFCDAMLEVPILNSSFTPFDAKGGISSSVSRRWQDELSVPEVSAIQVACGPAMEELGYEVVGGSALSGTRYWLSLPLALGNATLANRDRMGNIASYILRRARYLRGVTP